MCDCLVALGRFTSTGATLFAKNSDRPPGERQIVEWQPSRWDRAPLRVTHIDVEPHRSATIGTWLSRPEWMWGAEHGVNAAGVAIGNETIYTTEDPRAYPDALIGMDLVRLALERAATAADAVAIIGELLERYGQGGSGHQDQDRPYWSSFLVADPGGAFVVETSGRQWASESVTDVRAISNRTTIPAFDARHRHPRQPVESLVDPRWRASQAVLAAVPVDRVAVEAHLRSQVVERDGRPTGNDGWTVCMHVDGVEETTASMIAELPAGADPRAWFLVGHPCRRVYLPVSFTEPATMPPASRWPRLDQN
jgi:secernin